MIIWIGFFSDLTHGRPEEPTVESVVGSLDLAVVDFVASYLESGPVVASTMGTRAYDVLSSDTVDLGPLSIHADGVHAWPSDLSHYVREYRAALPESFIDFAKARGWESPSLSGDEMKAILAELFDV